MPFEEVKLNRSSELDNQAVESTMHKLQREAHLLLGGVGEGTVDAARHSVSSKEAWGRTLLSVGTAAALTIAMKRPGMLGNIGRGAGTLGAANFIYDLANPYRLSAMGDAISDTWQSGANFDRNYGLMKKELGKLSFDTMLGVGGGALGAGFASRFALKNSIAEPILGRQAQAVEPPILADKTSLAAAEMTPAAQLSRLEATKPLELLSTEAPKGADALNVFSRSNEPLGRALSNFAHTPFELDGVKFASVEAFYQALKYLDPVKRAEMAPLWGSYAKSAANKAPKLSETSYMGETITLGSKEHHALIERAIKAKLEQNPNVLAGLLETGNRPIVHDTGKGMNFTRQSNFPDPVFASMLEKVRADYQAKGFDAGKFNPSALDVIDAKGGKSTSVPVSIRDTVSGADKIFLNPVAISGEANLKSVADALSTIKRPELHEWHNLEDYSRAFAGFDRKVSSVVGGGSDSIALKLEDGNVLKITTRDLPADLGSRPFDLPVLERGSKPVGIGDISVNYFIQPFASKPKQGHLGMVADTISKSGYNFVEPFISQVGVYKGQAYLLDPFAVKPKN